MYHAIIIGAGVTGSSVSRELSRYKLKVAVFEKDSDVCGGASKSNSATIHSGHDAKYGTNKAYYNILGNRMYDKLCAELQVPFVRNGTIVFAADQREWDVVVKLKDNAEKNGVPDVRVLDRAGLEQIEAGFSNEVIGGLYAPTGGVVCPYSLVIALCENAAMNGVEFKLNEGVEKVERVSDHYVVHTKSSSYETKLIFNCAGVNADLFNNMVSKRKLVMLPRKGEHIILDKKFSPFVKCTVTQTPVFLHSGGHTKGMGIIPSVDGTVLLGCTAHDVADRNDSACTRKGLDEIVAYFRSNWRHFPISKAYPEFPSDGVIGAFSGLRPHLDTDDFVVGECQDSPGFFNAAGIESPGLTSAPAIAHELAAAAAERYGLELNPDFNPIRERKKLFREMTSAEREQAIRENPGYERIVCRCEQVTEADITAAIRGYIGATNVNAVKMRTRASMGRCQGGFCGPEILRILSEELHTTPLDITLRGDESRILLGRACE